MWSPMAPPALVPPLERGSRTFGVMTVERVRRVEKLAGDLLNGSRGVEDLETIEYTSSTGGRV